MNRIQHIALSFLFTALICQNNLFAQSVSGSINGHDYVDLGLSVKWATCNVGADNPEEYGNYYAWGETTTKETYTEGNYKTLGKDVYGDIAGDSRYDTARANWGASWRLPTRAECQELKDNCTWTWTTQGGHNGYRVTGPNGNSIFLPAAGLRSWKLLRDAGSWGRYWTSAPYEDIYYGSCDLYFTGSSRHVGWNCRHCGQSVRPIAE